MLKTKTKFISTIAIIILITSGITVFIIFPTIKNIKNISSKINDIRLDLEKKYDNRQNLRTVITRFKKIEESSDKFLNIYVEKNKELKLIIMLEEIAKKNNLEQNINTLTYKNKDKNDKNDKKPIAREENEMDTQLQLTGDYINIIKYLYDLRRLPYYINIKSISIQNTTALNANTKVENKNNAEAIIYAYSYVNEPAIK